MPESIAASMTFALASASMRQPKLLQPSPTTETSSDPILRVCIIQNVEATLNRKRQPICEPCCFNFPVARASRVLVSAARRKDCFRQVAGNWGRQPALPRETPRKIVGQRFLAADP